MNTGGITTRIFRFAKALVGHIPGGLGQVSVLSSMIFSGMSARPSPTLPVLADST
jgi:TRAP-type C4-dicarboxylate transport system permease large subunit